MRVRPILFNVGMVQAILEGRKTVTRRIVKQEVWEDFVTEYGRVINYLDQKNNSLESPLYKAPCQSDSILYVRETWAFIPCIGCNGEYARPGAGMNCYDTQAVEYDDGYSISDGCFVYRADCRYPERITWRPSIHMPKAVARIWLKVKDVRVEHLQEMTLDGFLSEGVAIRPEAFNDPENAYMQARDEFIEIWDSTIPRGQQDLYGWEANPWVWVIEFERCGNPEEQHVPSDNP